MTANKYLDIPIAGQILRLNGGFPAKEHKSMQHGIQKSVKVLNEGGGVVIFPEGGLPINGKPREPKQGIVKIVSETGAHVHPFYIHKQNRQIFPRFTTIEGEPFDAKGMTADQIMSKIYELKDLVPKK